ncbi:MAG: hypothetical protein A2173_10965 [Planctomycetes bacterium RBG_13_44_8b]|nr:MAG: hypothetical protein A2173_10965 [Planctomycetes bacterium RBG_13_44_8b]
METNRNKHVIIYECLVMVFIATSMGYCGSEKKVDNKIAPTRLDQVVRPPMDSLFQWPASSVLNGPNRVDSNAVEVVWPKRQCREWLNKVLAPSWLPSKGPELIFIKREFEQRDVVRATWEINGYKLEVSQTAGIFAIKVSPLDSLTTGLTQEDKIENAKRICLEIFNKIGYRWSADGEKVPLKNLNQKIVMYSFRSESINYTKDDQSVWGTPQTIHEAGVSSPTDDAEIRRQMDPNNPDWDNSSKSFDYWFRMVTWWNNGRSIGFYFLKVEGGAWSPSYDANFDRNFFRVRGQ